uniref:Uncharacterized protein n=1 Tax=Brassica oleracea TaxID=3712 RepID=A0A3P6BCG3_BRAOL|nr:unnamed protein product [Brassica oleracea]
MASLSTTLKPLASFSPFVKQRNPNSNSNACLVHLSHTQLHKLHVVQTRRVRGSQETHVRGCS